MTNLGIIGGSGLYSLPGLEDVEEQTLGTPFGKPSSPIVSGSMSGTQIHFLARHGRGHTLGPSEIPFRANIHAMKQLGVDHILSVSAVGSLRQELPPGTAVFPDQLVDRTIRGERTFFDRGIVAHVSLADPFCTSFRQHIHDVATGLDRHCVLGGSYVCIEGPQFSTRMESRWFRSLGATVIGMTALPEARLAREAGLCYALVAMVTDYDAWHETEGHVTVDLVLRVLKENTEYGRNLIRSLVSSDIPGCDSGCRHALDNAIITDLAMIGEDVRARVAALLPDTIM